ncbi:polysaccharide deacetylase family protein [Haladaptatus salinisoli]|uniref:polysaccharide deacetylase family protein n=1 Tax=Haladaptatus salinisoli TaxID=2884876 RepID=UPI001D0BB033|nr:polysaccharide deacetylase family protein [Haladaptatus salinisoli]
MTSVPNALTFDLEHWYSATLVRDAVDDPRDRVHESVAIVRHLLDKHEVTATFFVVGQLAREYPDLIEQLADDGHEIGSHGHTHTPLHDLTAVSFRRELAASADAIESATGRRPEGFRAPNFSVGPETEWAFDALLAEGYRYDSSVFPAWTPMYGVPRAAVYPYSVDVTDPFTAKVDGELWEFPAAVFHPRIRMPIAGGFYARLLPVRVIQWGIRLLNRREIPATLYFHPWEFNPAVKVADLPSHNRFITFHGIDRTREKLDQLLNSFEFGSIEDVFGPMDDETQKNNSSSIVD